MSDVLLVQEKLPWKYCICVTWHDCSNANTALYSCAIDVNYERLNKELQKIDSEWERFFYATIWVFLVILPILLIAAATKFLYRDKQSKILNIFFRFSVITFLFSLSIYLWFYHLDLLLLFAFSKW